MFGAQKEDRSRDLLRLAYSSQGNRRKYSVAGLGVIQRWSRHVGRHPPWSHAVYVNSIAREFCAESFHHANHRSFARCIITVKGFTTLSRGGTDDHNTACRLSGTPALPLHLRHTMLDQPKDTVQIHRDRLPPLLLGHLINGSVVWRPDAVIHDQAVKTSKVANCCFD